ncbi:MAG: winged helix-turn-helix domain-containing protein [Limisphaerales bacterium]
MISNEGGGPGQRVSFGRREVRKHDLPWARNALREEGLLRMPQRGIWQITEAGERDVEAWAQRVKKMTDSKADWIGGSDWC